MRQGVIYIIIGILCMACASKAVVTPAEKEELKKAVSTPGFNISLDWAFSLNTEAGEILNSFNPSGTIANGNRFYIQDGSYSFAVAQDTLRANLPYFGIRQISGNVNGNQGINIEEPFTNWKLQEGKNDRERTIEIRAKEDSEIYDITVTLYAKGKAGVVVNSSQRQSIRYTGTWE